MRWLLWLWVRLHVVQLIISACFVGWYIAELYKAGGLAYTYSEIGVLPLQRKNNSVNDICKTLNISRATLYRYIQVQ